MTNLLVDLRIPYPSNLPLGKANDLLVAIRAQRCVTADDYAALGELLKQLKAHAREIEEGRKFSKAPIVAAGKAHDEYYRPELADCETGETVAKEKLIAFEREQQRIQREQQREADERAQRERERLAKVAAANAERARLLEAQGRAAEAAKAAERAAEFEERSSTVVAPIIDREPPKVAGISSREVYRFEVTDPTKVPRQYLSVDEAKIRKVVAALKGDAQIDGVRIWKDNTIAAGASRR
jgi:hypothetical protein